MNYTPFSFANPVYEPRDYLAPGISYSGETPGGYTVFDDVYDPYIYSPPPVQSYMSGPPLTYTPFDPLPSVYDSLNPPPKPSGYQPLDLTALQTILSKIGNP